MRTWNSLKNEWLKDSAFKKEYDKLESRYALIDKIVGARIKKKLTQAQLAKKVGTKQSAIARLESGSVNPSLNFIERIASALGSKLNIEFV